MDEFIEQVNQSDRARELLRRTIDGCQSATDELKIDWLARVLVDGVSDGDRIDLAFIVTTKLARLDGPHVRLLALFAARQSVRLASPTELDPDLKPFEETMAPLLADLESLGMVSPTQQNPNHSPERWSLSGFGQQCVAYLADRRVTP